MTARTYTPPAPLPRIVGELTGLAPQDNRDRKATYYFKREWSRIRYVLDDLKNQPGVIHES